MSGRADARTSRYSTQCSTSRMIDQRLVRFAQVIPLDRLEVHGDLELAPGYSSGPPSVFNRRSTTGRDRIHHQR
jgi:hypothetical protein